MKKLFIILLLLVCSLQAQFLNFSYTRLDTTMARIDTGTTGLNVYGKNGSLLGEMDSAAFAVIDSSILVGDSFTAQQHMDVLRSIINPWRSITYLPIGSPYTTPSITADTPTKILIPTTPKEINGFAFQDVGGGNVALQFIATMGIQDSIGFNVTMTTSMRSSANNTLVTLSMYKNGNQESGVIISRKISTGADTGALAIHGHFHMVTGDYIEIYVTTTLTSTITFEHTSIDISEKY
jgi:hypothetical protein